MYRFSTTANVHPLDVCSMETDDFKKLYRIAMDYCRRCVGNTCTIDYDLLIRNLDDCASCEGTITNIETGELICFIYVSPVRCSCTRYYGWKETDELRKGWLYFCSRT